MTATTAIARDITSTVEALDKHLTDLIATATAVQEALRAGRRVPGMFTTLGQEPVRIEKATAKLEALLLIGPAAGLTTEAIEKAYNDGTTPWHERAEA